jgi:putative ABC transport system permease protein
MRVDVTRQAGTGGGEQPQPGRSRRSGVPKSGRIPPAGPFSSVRLAFMRLTRGWELLLAVGAGILVAVVLICTVPLYNTLVANIQLQRAINTGDPTVRNVQPTVTSSQISTDLRNKSNSIVSSLAGQYLKSFTASKPVYYTVADNMLMLSAGKHTFDPANPQAPNLIFEAFDYSAVGPHMHFVAGTTPQVTGPGETPQVVITQQMAQDFHLKVADRIKGTEFGDHANTILLTISGIWAPNETDPFWNGATFARGSSSSVDYKLLITYDTFFNQIGAFSGVGMQQNWIYYTNPSAITVGNMDAISSAIGNLRSRLNGEILTLPGVGSVGVETNLAAVVRDIQSQESLLALPLYVIVAQIVGLALLFVTAMAGLLIEGQSQEISTLKSRGASGTQLLSTFTTQGLLLGILAAIAGPFLAALLGLALIHWFIPASVINGAGVGSGYFSQIAAPGTVIIPAVIGALLGVGAVTYSAWQSSRLDVLAFRREQGRSTRVPLWKRYYLDIALAVLCLVGYLELGQFGSANTREQLGGSASPLLLLTPALLLLAGALLVLRIFPYGAALGSRLAARGNGLTALLAFSQVERNPARYSRMTLLLVLAVGLGLFALSFDSSLVTNEYDRAAYSVGADIRFSAITSVNNTGIGEHDAGLLTQRMEKLPGVLGITQVYRDQVSTTPDEGSDQINALGIDPATFQQVAGPVSWRQDYSSTPLVTLMAELRSHVQGEAAGSPSNPIWTIVSAQFASRYQVKVGQRFTLQVGGSPLATTSFVVGAIASEFPTLYPGEEPGGFIVLDLNDYLSALRNTAQAGVDPSSFSANEFWMRTTSNANQHAELIKQLASPAIIPQENASTQTFSLADQASQIESDPISAGMRGLLLVGAVTAALLAVLGSIVQALLATQQRARQFAVMRTVGMSGRQLTLVLLGEQVVVYLFGLIGGTILGLLLVTATLPFLQFSDTTVDPAKVGVPPYLLTFNGVTILYFYAALLIAFVFALLIAARYANSIGLGKALRLGED